MILVLENKSTSLPVPTSDIANIGDIVRWYEESQYEAGFLPEDDYRQGLERCTGKYFQKLTIATEAKFWWLVQFLPETLKERLIASQGSWVASRRVHFALLNSLHGLLGGGHKPFDGCALLLAQAEFVKARGLELESVYAEFHSWWRIMKVTQVV